MGSEKERRDTQKALLYDLRLIFRSCTNRRRYADWRENFLPGKEKTRRNPDGFQAFLTQSRRKIFRLDVCRRLLVQLLSTGEKENYTRQEILDLLDKIALAKDQE